jgi:putative transposase
MSNHFHILIKAKDVGGVSKFISKLSTGYAAYFNKKYDRSGSLFEGTFKAEHVDNDRYLKYLFAYIHLNPVKMFEPKWKENGIADREGATAFLDHYKYSSYHEYTNKSYREESSLLEAEVFPKYFVEKHSFKNFVQDWFTLR